MSVDFYAEDSLKNVSFGIYFVVDAKLPTMNPPGNLVDVHAAVGPVLMNYWITRLENEATDFELINNTHISNHYRLIAQRLRNYQGTPLINGAEVQTHITGVGASMAAKINEWTVELQSVDLRSFIPNTQNTQTNSNNTVNSINNNINQTTPSSSAKKRSISDSQSNSINNNNLSLPFSVQDWLRNLGLSEYLPAFLNGGIETINQVSQLTQNVLRNPLMITNADHIRILLNGINSLKHIKLAAFPELSKLNEISIRQFGLNNEKIYPRAVEYMQQGKVLSITKKPGIRYEARVSGNDADPLHPEYSVVIRFGVGRGDPILNIENCLCSCPFFRRQKLRPPCKHLIAVLLQLYHKSETVKVVQPSPSRSNSQTISSNNSNNNASNLASSSDDNNSPSPPKRSRKSPTSGTSRKRAKTASQVSPDAPMSPEAMWFAAVERHVARLDPGNSQASSQSSQGGSQATSTPNGKKPKEYLPKPRSGAWALLLALHRAEPIPGYLGYMSSAELKSKAQPLCDSSFEIVAPSPDYRQNFTAWSSMKTLEGHNLVKTILTPDHYTLTEAGRELARKLEAIAEESAAVGNFTPGTKTPTPLRTSGTSPNNTNLIANVSNNNNNNNTTPPNQSCSMSAPVRTPSLSPADRLSPSQPLEPSSQTRSPITSPISPQTSPIKPFPSQGLSLSQSTQSIEDDLERALRESREMSQRSYFYVDPEGVKVESKEKAEVDIQDGVLKYRIKYKDTGQYGWINEDTAQDFDVEDEDMDLLEDSMLSQPVGTQNSNVQPELLILARLMEVFNSQTASQSPAQPPITAAVPSKETLIASGTVPVIKTPTSPVPSKSVPTARVLFPQAAIDLTESDDEAEEQPLSFQIPRPPAPASLSTTPKSTTTATPPQNKSPNPAVVSPPSISLPVATSPAIPTSPIAPIQQNNALPSNNTHHDEHASILSGLSGPVEGYLLPTELLNKAIYETEIVMVMDHRELWPDIDMDQQLKAKGIRVERRSLKLSDLVFVIRGVNGDTPEYMMNLVIERKQASDFFASIRDKRLEEQKHRLRTLKSYGINSMVLLEGRLGVEANKENVCILIPQEHLDNLIFMDGFPVKKTKSASQTLEFLAQTHVYLQEALKGARIRISGITFEEYNRLNAKSFGLTRQSLFERQLMQFHMMTPLTAKTITKHFPTVKHLVEAFSSRRQPDMLCELVVSTRNPFHPVSKELSTRLFNYYCL